MGRYYFPIHWQSDHPRRGLRRDMVGHRRDAVYNTVQGAFRDVIPKRPLFSGGYGAVELVARYSDINLDSELISGGKFKRFTPMVNWYLTDYLRLVAAYGVGRLDRFNLKGTTQFFQTLTSISSSE